MRKTHSHLLLMVNLVREKEKRPETGEGALNLKRIPAKRGSSTYYLLETKDVSHGSVLASTGMLAHEMYAYLLGRLEAGYNKPVTQQILEEDEKGKK